MLQYFPQNHADTNCMFMSTICWTIGLLGASVCTADGQAAVSKADQVGNALQMSWR